MVLTQATRKWYENIAAHLCETVHHVSKNDLGFFGFDY
jgi:hypothetical protein